MQERQFDGKDILTSNASLDDFIEASKKEENKFVALDKPGAEITLPDGTKYVISKNGTWIIMDW